MAACLKAWLRCLAGQQAVAVGRTNGLSVPCKVFCRCRGGRLWPVAEGAGPLDNTAPSAESSAAPRRVKQISISLALAPPSLQVRGFLEQGPNRFERPLIHGHWDSELFAGGPAEVEARPQAAARAIGLVLLQAAAMCKQQGMQLALGRRCGMPACRAQCRGGFCASADLPDGSTVLLWRKNPPPPEPTRYNLTAFRWGGGRGRLGLGGAGLEDMGPGAARLLFLAPHQQPMLPRRAAQQCRQAALPALPSAPAASS